MLMRGGLLSEDESLFYEQCVSISEKKGSVKDAITLQVQEEKLTALEVAFLLDQVTARIEDLQLRKQKIPNALQERQEKLKFIAKSPISPSLLKHHAALGKLWKQAAPLMYLKTSGGKLLSPAETKKRGQLEDILCEIVNLEESSRGLLEDDESYEEKIQTYRRELQQRYGNISVEKGSQKKKRAVGNVTSSSNSKNNAWNSTTKFQTPTVGGKGGGGWMSGRVKKSKKTSLSKGDVFGALMADSDSDEEEGDENRADTSSDLHTSLAPSSPSAAAGVSNSSRTNKRIKKKKNKNKKTSNKSRQGDDGLFLDAAVAANNAASKKEAKAKEERKSDVGFNVISFLLLVITEWIIPIILAILMWFAAALFGKSKNKKKNA